MKKVVKKILQFKQSIVHKQQDIYRDCKRYISRKKILEIGGPSKIFSKRGKLPVYGLIGQLDTCNFSENTIWNGPTSLECQNYYSQSIVGKRYISETTNLSGIASGVYDGILAAHVIEHSTNPLLALSEWSRILKEYGVIVFLAPHKDGTFDHRRPVSTLRHLMNDFDNMIDEKDLYHLPEILELHDIKMDPIAGTFENFKKRSIDNYNNRCLHHHVFDTKLSIKMIDYMKLQIIAVATLEPCHIIILAQKLGKNLTPDNNNFLCSNAIYKKSPFPSDRIFDKLK